MSTTESSEWRSIGSQQPAFSITGPPQLEIDPRTRQGSTSYTVTNLTSRAVHARLLPQALPGADPSWVSVPGPVELPMALGATITVAVSVTVPPNAPAGRYGLRLDVVPEDDTEAKVEGPSTAFGVGVGAEPAGRPRWLLRLIIGVLVLLLAVGAGVFFLLRGSGSTPDAGPAGQSAPGQAPSPSTGAVSSGPSNAPPTWGRWQDLGGNYDAPPAISARGPDRLDVFVAPPGGETLDHRVFDGTAWSQPETLGGNFIDRAAAVSWGPDRIDVFRPNHQDEMMHAQWQGTWSDFSSTGAKGLFISDPAVASWAPNRMDLFFKYGDNQLRHQWFDGRWSGVEVLGDQLFGSPAAVSRGPNLLDVFYEKTDGHVYQLSWNGSAWNGPNDRGGGGNLQSDLAVTSWGPDRLDLFAKDVNDNLVHRSWDGKNWSDWETIATGIQGPPAAVATGKNRIDVVALGTNHHLLHLTYR